jgi:hypothetical protein
VLLKIRRPLKILRATISGMLAVSLRFQKPRTLELIKYNHDFVEANLWLLLGV